MDRFIELRKTSNTIVYESVTSEGIGIHTKAILTTLLKKNC